MTTRWPDSMSVIERGWLSSNTIVCRGRQPAVIDSGYVSHAALGVEVVRNALAGQQPALLVNTHLHSDHCGGNAAMQAAWPGIRTHVPTASFDAARRWDVDALTFEACGQECAPFRVDAGFASGDHLLLGDLEFEALSAPGHDPQMMVLWCADERLLVSADALWEDGFGVIFPEIEGEPGFDDLRATLQMIEALDVELVIPGHGAPFTDVGTALDRAYGRLGHFEADPTRHARHALKVLVKFLLMDRAQLSLDELTARLTAMRYAREINDRFLQVPDAQLAAWIATSLIKSGVARLDGATLHDVP
ncbi:hypothetical protein BH10PSE17_BH10PSE17_33210 [soil metagenome]